MASTSFCISGGTGVSSSALKEGASREKRERSRSVVFIQS
jgi:hypothetical protein